MEVAECGLIVHPDKGFLAASPDGIVHEVESGATGLLEIKCPYTKRNSTLTEACENDDFFCCIANSKLHLKCHHTYYHQVQLQLYCFSRTAWCDFLSTPPRTVGVREFILI